MAGLTIGLELVVSIVVTAAVGYWADGRFGTYPWLTFVGFVLGTAAGFRSLFRMATKLDKGAASPPEEPSSGTRKDD